ncbi:hypothetical protein QBA54_32755 [Streptomyces sp. B21-108]|uniref:hypothetical protein n=1 Tax=Streptomyces sp. B21-108 TaxID=3039419 RepID=UPI002FF0A0BE
MRIDDVDSVHALVHNASGSISIVQGDDAWTVPAGFTEATGEQREEILQELFYGVRTEPTGPTAEEQAARDAVRAGKIDAAKALVTLGLTAEQAHYVTGVPVSDINGG